MSIVVSLNHIEKLNINLSSSKGTYKVFDLNKIYPDSEKTYKTYKEAKDLLPFSEYKNPYWDFLLLSDNYFFGLGNYKGTHTNMYAQELYRIIYKFIETIFISKQIGNIKLGYYPIYKKIIKPRSNKNLFILNKASVDILEEYLFYSDYNNPNSHSEENNVIYLKNHTFDNTFSGDVYLNNLKRVENFFKSKKEINFKFYDNNICNLEIFSDFTNQMVNYKLDNIFLDANIYYWYNKKNRSYYDAQGYYNLILLSLEKLNLNGNLIMSYASLDSQLSLDLLALLQIYFQNVFIIKTDTIRVISDHKIIIAQRFLGIKDRDYFLNLKNISREWYNFENSCGLKIKKPPEKDSIYITSLFNYKGNYEKFKNFLILENNNKIKIFQKIVDNYNYVKNQYNISPEKGSIAEKLLILQIFKRSLRFLKDNNIPIKVKYSNIDREILDITNNLEKENFYRKFKNKYIEASNSNNLDSLYEMENRLKIYKRKMDNMDPKKLYNITKIFTKPFFGLKEELKYRLSVKNISQGFIKMYEILVIFNFFDDEDINSFHLCEAPG